MPTDIPARALDGNTGTRFPSGVPQSSATAQTFTVGMSSAQTFSQISIASQGTDYAHNYQVLLPAQYAGQQGHLRSVDFQPPAPGPAVAKFWEPASRAVVDFWQRVATHSLISADFRR